MATYRNQEAGQITLPPDAARTQVSKQFFLWLDEPTDWNVRVRRLRLSGWCVAKSGEPVTTIRARVGAQVFEGRFDRDRPEVAQHVGRPDAPRWCGFTVDVRIPFGKSRLELQVARADGTWKKAYARNVWGPALPGRAERKLWREIDAATVRQRFAYWLDRPADWSGRVRYLRVSGWCLANEGENISELRARLRGKCFSATYGILRPDVAATVTSAADVLRCGFSVDVVVPCGSSTLVLETRRGDGPWEGFFETRVRGPWLPSAGGRAEESVGAYAEWIRLYDRLTRRDRAAIERQIAGFSHRPTFSILLPAYNPDPKWLRRAVGSVRKQLYPHWQLCVVDDASTAPRVRSILTRLTKIDHRIQVRFRETNGGIAAASNDALDLATGDFVALLDHDDELAPAALYFVAHEIKQHPDAQLIYSDEDKLDLTGRRTNPHFKSDWNPTLFLAQNYFSHLGVFKAELIKRLGFRAGFEGSQDYDLILRASENVDARQIRHIPRILYHWRMSAESAALSIQAKPKARGAAIKAVGEHLQRRKIAARVERTELEDFQRIRYQLPALKPKISIVIPTRDLLERLRPCVESILGLTSYPNFELLLVDNGTRDPAALAYLAQLPSARVRVLRLDEEFNYARLSNLGVHESDAEFVALLNNDLTVITPDWLEEMLGQAMQSEVGAVGARLLFPDGRIQHAGVILGAGGGGLADHAHKGLPSDNHGYFSRALLAQEVSAVTAACMLVRRAIYLEVGGFDEAHLKIGFNDVDFCLRLRERGYRIVYTPYAELRHWESASRGLEETPSQQQRFWTEVKYVKEKWAHALAADPFYNPNLALSDELFTLAFPPRGEKPWQER